MSYLCVVLWWRRRPKGRQNCSNTCLAEAEEECVYKCSHHFVRLLEGVCLDRERTLWSQWYLHSTSSNKEIWPCVSLNLTPDLSWGSLITSVVTHLSVSCSTCPDIRSGAWQNGSLLILCLIQADRDLAVLGAWQGFGGGWWDTDARA